METGAKICTQCKLEKSLEQFFKNASRKDGYDSQCKDCAKKYAQSSAGKERQKKFNASSKGKAKAKRFFSSTRGRYANLKNSAKTRNIDISITLEEYIPIIDNPCYYCNDYFDKTPYGYGLDRIDNNIGYHINNVVHCCGTCNRIKSELLTQEETLAAVKAIILVRETNHRKAYDEKI